MTAHADPVSAFTLACPNFTADELEATRRLLQLLGTHLKHPWRLSESADVADVVVLNLDGNIHVEFNRQATITGCSRRPRQHQGGTLHRPLRGYELLALLNREGQARSATTVASAASDARYRLRFWPYESNHWHRSRWLVMACLRHAYHSAAEVAQRSGVPQREVTQCLDALQRIGALDSDIRSDRPHRAAMRPQRGALRAIAAKVGAILGFSA